VQELKEIKPHPVNPHKKKGNHMNQSYDSLNGGENKTEYTQKRAKAITSEMRKKPAEQRSTSNTRL
jgi:hypothetical protein